MTTSDTYLKLRDRLEVSHRSTMALLRYVRLLEDEIGLREGNRVSRMTLESERPANADVALGLRMAGRDETNRALEALAALGAVDTINRSAGDAPPAGDAHVLTRSAGDAPSLMRTMHIELGERKAGEKRTFSAVLSTATPVRRRDYDGEFLEVLSHANDAIDLSRSPLPLLESHDLRSLPIGIIENLRIADGKLRGDVTFGASQRAQEISADVEAGVVRALSVGYSIQKTVTQTAGKVRTVIATRWTPHEASAVAIGADAGAGFGRSDDAVAGERARCSEITRLTRQLGAEGDAFASRLIDSGASLEAARTQVLNRLIELDGPEISPHVRVDELFITPRAQRGSHLEFRSARVPVDTASDFRAAAVDALLMRAGVHVAKPHAAARDVSGSVLEIARTCVSRVGGPSHRSTEDLLRRAMTTSDFPQILADSMHRAVRNGYEIEPSSHRAWVHAVPVADFRDQHRPILGSAPSLAQVQEHGEYTHGSMTEDSASYRVAKYGKIISLSWEVLVNDQLGAFLRVQPAMGQAARRLEADTVYALLAANAGAGPTMQDTVALFHSSHGNLGTAAAFTAATLGAARALLRKQTALGGGYLSLVPRHLIVPAELEQTAETIIAQATRSVTTIDAATPQWIASLELVVEPRLAATAIYLAASSSQIDHCELGLLEENAGGPLVTSKEHFEADIFEWKVRHVFGAKFLDWRGIVKQPIAAS